VVAKKVQTSQPSNFDIYNLGTAAVDAGEQIYGYMGLAESAIMADKDTTAGSAVQPVTDYIRYLEKTDKTKYKNAILQNYGYLVYIYPMLKKVTPQL
jgi:hypothetical protein